MSSSGVSSTASAPAIFLSWRRIEESIGAEDDFSPFYGVSVEIQTELKPGALTFLALYRRLLISQALISVNQCDQCSSAVSFYFSDLGDQGVPPPPRFHPITPNVTQATQAEGRNSQNAEPGLKPGRQKFICGAADFGRANKANKTRKHFNRFLSPARRFFKTTAGSCRESLRPLFIHPLQLIFCCTLGPRVTLLSSAFRVFPFKPL
jgi:hypothetical protein